MRVPSCDVDSTEVARLVDYAERSRADDWSLRSALVRYAQLAPERASAVLELVRRTDGALKHLAQHPERATDADGPLLAVARSLDQIGDLLATWAVDRGEPPHDQVDRIAREVFQELGRLGVEREERTGRPPAGARRGP